MLELLLIGLIVLFFVTLPVRLWVFYLAIMNLKRVKDQTGSLPPVVLKIGGAALILGYVYDFAVNVTYGTVVFLELPRELTVSSRIRRWTTSTPPKYLQYRYKFACWFRDDILKPFDPSGGHD